MIAAFPKQNVTPTHDDVLGPYYRPGAPIRADGAIAGGIASPDPDSGEPTKLTFGGTVSDEDGKPIGGAVVDLWQASGPDASGQGVYDTDSPDFKFRGKVIADANGKYSANTIIPGHYALNGDGQPPFRPEHIHAVVSAPGDNYHGVKRDDGTYGVVVDAGNKFNVLVTQIYFKNDGDVDKSDQAGDPFYQQNDGVDRALDLQRQVNTSGPTPFIDATASLDFTLAKMPTERHHIVPSKN